MSHLQNIFYEPLLYVYPTHSTLAYRPVNRSFTPLRNRDVSNLNLRHRYTGGIISSSAAKAITNCIGWLDTFAKVKRAENLRTRSMFNFRTSMVTLTLPCQQFSSDKWIKRNLFNAFISYASKYFGMKNYVWRAEAQANGNIHFHIIIDVFIPYQRLRSVWNRICSNHGYTYNSVDGKEANSTDVHSLKNIKDTLKYMVKYCTKNDVSRRKIEGALWGASDSLRKLGACIISASGSIQDNIVRLTNSGSLRYYAHERAFIVKEHVKVMINKIGGIRQHLIKHYRLYCGQLKDSVKQIKEGLCLKELKPLHYSSVQNLVSQLQLQL